MNSESTGQDLLRRRLIQADDMTRRSIGHASLTPVEQGRLDRREFERHSRLYFATPELQITSEDANTFMEIISDWLDPEYQSIVANTSLDTVQQLLQQVSTYRRVFEMNAGKFEDTHLADEAMYADFKKSGNENAPLLYALLNGLS